MNYQTALVIFKALRGLYRADRANVYTLPHDCQFLIHVNTPGYDGKYWRFEPKEGYPGVTLVTLKAYGAGVCDGASLAPDSPAGVLGATGAHDPGYMEMEDIAEAWSDYPYAPGVLFARDWVARRGGESAYWTAADVRHLFDAIFGDAIAEVSHWPIITRLYYSAVRYFGGIFHTSGKILQKAVPLLLLPLLAAGCSGCLTPADIADWPNGFPALEKVESGSDEAPALNVDEVPFDELTWTYGGFSGGGAVLDTPRLANLSVKSDGLSFTYLTNLASWGYAYDDAGGALACLFCRVDGRWVGGKIDWISSSRWSRDFKNPKSGYGGWKPSALTEADAYAFVIVNKDGKRRSNVVLTGGL